MKKMKLIISVLSITLVGILLLSTVSSNGQEEQTEEGWAWTGHLTKISEGDLSKILEEHKKWVDSIGEEEGKQADLSKVDLSGANLSGANLSGANLSRTDLSGAYLNGANLSRAELIDTILKDAIFSEVNLTGSRYEPSASPYKGSLGGIKGLATIKFDEGKQFGLVQLRAALKESGLRDLEREATYSIEYWKTNYAPWYAKWTKRLLFEWTCGYGLNYLRPLLILSGLFMVFSIVYIFPIVSKSKSGIYKIWPSGRNIEEKAIEKLDKLLGVQLIGYAFYYSVLSTFHIGWRDLNVGSWIARVQPNEYFLKASGWVRTVSGIQSLISIYLLALWVLTQFGRPFE